jgi:hypothetical protein
MKKAIILILFITEVAFCCYARGKREPPPPSPPSPVNPLTPEQPRIYQTDVQIAYYIRIELTNGDSASVNAMLNSGCKFMAALGVAQTHAGANLTPSQINCVREDAQSRGYVGYDMTTNNPAGVMNLAFQALGVQMIASQVDVVTTLDRIVVEYDSTIIRGMTENDNTHFCEGDEDGNVVYNPYPGSVYREINRYYLIRIRGIPRGLQHSVIAP